MQQLLEMTEQVAKSEISVLITGPNGAGKEKIAQIIQANSMRKNEAFIKVNIGAMPIDLMEAELFGGSPHLDAFTENDFPMCETCHSNHKILKPFDAMVGTPFSILALLIQNGHLEAATDTLAKVEEAVSKYRTYLTSLDESEEVDEDGELEPAAEADLAELPDDEEDLETDGENGLDPEASGS